MASNNSVLLIGNISNDPVQMGGQKGGVRFNIAVNKGKDSNGNDKPALFVQIKSFDDHNQYRKGMKIVVAGSLDISQGTDGKYYTSILTSPWNIGVVGSNGRSQSSNGGGYHQNNGNNYQNNRYGNGGNNGNSSEGDDIIPF